jgi:glutathione S-transferase
MTHPEWPSLITWLTLALLVGVAINVGRARGRYGIAAPATTGHPEFERYYRVQMNTTESALAFLPALWLAAWYWSPTQAAACGAVWLAGRVWYALAYVRDPARRSGGFGLSMLALSVLLVGAAIGWVRSIAA